PLAPLRHVPAGPTGPAARHVTPPPPEPFKTPRLPSRLNPLRSLVNCEKETGREATGDRP
uniref:Uncharacterized protein n=1 Tax=Aegilops tauschii subsp. strangulata TaxID=200361 RepID=A0A453M2I7_AEGTS